MEGWFFLPDWKTASWEEARQRLSEAPKPLVVAPLIEHGFLTAWSIGEIPTALRTGAEANQRNQIGFYEGKLHALGLGESDSLTFTPPDHEVTIGVVEFRRWSREYAILAGVGLMKRKLPGVGAITVSSPGTMEPPIGLPADVDYDAGCGHQH